MRYLAWFHRRGWPGSRKWWNSTTTTALQDLASIMTIRLTVMTYRQRWYRSRSAKKPRRQTLNSLPSRTEVTDRVVSDTSGSTAPELVDFREITTVIGPLSVESQLQSSLSSARGSPDSGEPRQARWVRFRRSTPQSPRTSPRRRHRHVRAVYGKYRGRAH